MMDQEYLDTEQMTTLRKQLREDRYDSIEEWMEDSGYYRIEGWFPVQWADENDNPVDDPWIAFYWAKEAEAETIAAGQWMRQGD